jgi:oxalate decarboxylase/phosphoglucose isomerase-like protein (cupin superfamily)
MGSLLASAAAAGNETMQPPFGPAPPPLDGPELPSFRFPLGAQETHQFNGGTAKEATVVQFPVSEKLAGVYMTLEPGALRELHWHANAAEWAYVIEGRCRVTTIDPQNQCEIVDFGPGDVWYFPRGHGHSIQGIGPGTCVFVLVFDNGYFSEFGTFSISDWLGHTPPEVLAKTFNLPAATFADFPKKEVYIATGPVPLTVFGSHGRARTDEFAAGDVGYVPQGYGHYIENTGTDDLEVVAVFNNGTYQSVSITGWMAANPELLLATNFGVPESVFAKFPKGAVVMPE